ncbi:efflux RND transporter periplasmic adaptor subunit [Zhouia sp. PK063]|uniref:efflux RND transporter periplasmic adaptor subunit n=1 Tax=Zhouia sp. PK063 TaxID=3373602 RepID=UPI0037A25557
MMNALKKYGIYIAILIVGLLLGSWLFGGKTVEEKQPEKKEIAKKKNMYTCSMHPQIMQPEPGNCPICGMELIPVTESHSDLAQNQFKMSTNAMALANIETTKVGDRATANGNIELSGMVMPNEKTVTVQTSHVAGRIEKLYINFTGDEVKRGSPIALIYSPELLAAQKELLIAAKNKQESPQIYTAIREKLKLWKLSDAQINAIETSGKVNDYITIYANQNGVVTDKMVNEGDHVIEGTALYKITDLSKVWAVFDVYENQLPNVKVGDKIQIKTESSPQITSATIDFIDPVLNTSSRTVKVRATLRNTNDEFKPGMILTGMLEQENVSSGGITVPKSAVLWTGKKSVVYVQVKPDEPIFEARIVSLGNAIGDQYEIIKGLQSGEIVVVNGTFTVDAAAQLQLKKSMMTDGDESDKEDEHFMKMKLPEAFQKQLQNVIPQYICLKDAFVATNKDDVKSAIQGFDSAIKKLNDTTGDKMLLGHIQMIEKASQAILNSSVINQQRNAFILLSENMITLVTNLNKFPKTLYVQRCPMADNNEGASWLSENKEIKNPYFGAKMLSCGSTIKTLN